MAIQATAHRIATPEIRPVAAIIAISSASQGNVCSILAIIFVPLEKSLRARIFVPSLIHPRNSSLTFPWRCWRCGFCSLVSDQAHVAHQVSDLHPRERLE
jgi:hypothetical protein